MTDISAGSTAPIGTRGARAQQGLIAQWLREQATSNSAPLVAVAGPTASAPAPPAAPSAAAAANARPATTGRSKPCGGAGSPADAIRRRTRRTRGGRVPA